MKFFIDTADLVEIRDLAATGLVDGVTTNPSLVAKTGRNFLDVVREICQVVPGPVSAEVTAIDTATMLAEGRKLAEICVTCVEHLKAAIGMLSDLKHADPILRHCLEIDRLESEADNVMRDIIVKLFRDEPDTRELIKMKAVIELLETVTDRCEDVANIIEGIVIEYS